MQKYYIYKVRNLINDKLYIGKTNNFEKRKLEHTRYDIDNGNIFHKALKKYGLDNFEWEIIDEAEGLEAINVLEKYYIEKYNSYKPNGYNMTKGGDGGSMWNARPVVCLSLSGEFIRRYDSAGETKAEGFSDSNVLECCKGILRQTKGYMFMFEDEYLVCGAKTYTKPMSSGRKRIIQCSMNGEIIRKFESITCAANETGLLRTRISAALIGSCKTAGGCIFVYEDEFPIKNLEDYLPRKKGRRVAKVDKVTNEIIQCYDSIAEAGKDLGVSYKAIHKVVDKEDRSAYGYKWKSI